MLHTVRHKMMQITIDAMLHTMRPNVRCVMGHAACGATSMGAPACLCSRVLVQLCKDQCT